MELLVIFEGDLEAAILIPFLAPYIRPRFGERIIQHNTQSNQTLRKDFKRLSEEHLRADRDNHVLCLVDMLNEPFGVADHAKSVAENFRAVQSAMRNSLAPELQHRFGAFPVVMEPETWLLADPKVMEKIDPSLPPVTEPEAVTHPANRLKELWNERHRGGFKKLQTGMILFRVASAQRIYDDNCPHFKELIDWLQNPPTTAPPSEASPISQKVVALNARFLALTEEIERHWKEAKTEADLDAIERLEHEQQEIYRQWSNQTSIEKSG